MNSPNRAIPYVPENTLDPAAGLNEAIDVIDAIIVPKVIRMDLTEPPTSPADGDLYVPASPAAGEWAGFDNHVVRFREEGEFWQAYTPASVYLLFNNDDLGLYKWDDGSSPGTWTLAAGLGDAPNDGAFYGRKGLAWEPLTLLSPVVTDATTARVAVPSDAGDYTRFTNAGAKTYEFDGADTWTIGTEFHGRNVGAGNLTVFGSGGFTLNTPTDGTNVIPQGGTFTVKIVGADEADLMGVTVPQS